MLHLVWACRQKSPRKPTLRFELWSISGRNDVKSLCESYLVCATGAADPPQRTPLFGRRKCLCRVASVRNFGQDEQNLPSRFLSLGAENPRPVWTVASLLKPGNSADTSVPSTCLRRVSTRSPTPAWTAASLGRSSSTCCGQTPPTSWSCLRSPSLSLPFPALLLSLSPFLLRSAWPP